MDNQKLEKNTSKINCISLGITNYLKYNYYQTKAITLVALVVTIVVLLILAGVTITSLLGDEGIISKAQQAAELTKRTQVIEAVQLDILVAQLEGDITKEKLEGILGNYGEVQYDEEGNITGIKVDGVKEIIPIEELYTGQISDGEQPDVTAPTANINLGGTSTTPGTAISATITFVDIESGVDIENCKYIYNTTSGNLGTASSSWDTATNFSTNPQTLNLTADAEGTYYLHVLTVDVAGNKGEQTSEAITVEEEGLTAEDIAGDIANNPTAYYGKTVSGYTCTNSSAVANWKIFYAGNDFSADSSYHVYLIADDYIPYANIPNSSAGHALNAGNSPRAAYFTNILNDYTGSASITDNNIKKLNNDYFTKGYSSSNNNMRSIAYMLDTNAWSVYAGEDADYAVGGPSIEMLMKSYSQAYSVDYRARASSAIGYQISAAGDIGWANGAYNMLNTSDSLYVITSESNAGSYWLSSPSIGHADYVMFVVCTGDINYDSYAGGSEGFRPLVCLSSDVKFKQLSDGNFEIK